MRAVIVYESMFGNTAAFAAEITTALVGAGVDAVSFDVRRVVSADLAGSDLLVVGAPTHAFSMSRRSTRDDAVRQGADLARAALGVREWMATLDGAFPSVSGRPAAAVFDTRVEKVRRLPGSAARRAARVLHAQGFAILDHPTSFYVVGVSGPPVEGEPARARAWAVRLAALVGAAA